MNRILFLILFFISTIISAQWNVDYSTGDPVLKTNYDIDIKGNLSLVDEYDNTFAGFEAGIVNTGGVNTAFGYQALKADITGYENTAIGWQSMLVQNGGYANVGVGAYTLYSNTTGYDNTSVGYWNLAVNTTGYNNTAIGHYSMQKNTIGIFNVAIGSYSLDAQINGDRNTGVGAWALGGVVASDSNVAIGHYAGYKESGGGNNSAPTASIYIGAGTRSSSNTATNEIIIGTEAVGEGSNTVVLGNTDVVRTVLRGDLEIDVYSQDAEPDIASDTFAFWVDTDDSNKYYLILDVGGTQKKMELL